MNFWENVIAELEYQGINRKTLAREAGFSVSLIRKGVLSGSSPSAETAVKIADYLKVSVEYLVTGVPDGPFESQPTAVFQTYEKYRDFLNKLDHMDENTRQAIIELSDKLSR